MLTAPSTGAVFAMVTLADASVPASVPSYGVTMQVTTLPLTKAPDGVRPAPTAAPSTVHV